MFRSEENRQKTVAPWSDSTAKCVAASSGALITSLFVTPLDVVRVRLQTQLASAFDVSGSRRSFRSMLRRKNLACMERSCRMRQKCMTGVLDSASTASRATTGGACMRFLSCIRLPSSSMQQIHFTGTFHALKHIMATEGVAGLWSGLSVKLAIAVPSTVLYFTTYDFILKEGRKKDPSPMIQPFLPMIAGSSARILVASIMSPLELMKTRIQSRTIKNDLNQSLTQTLRREGFQHLFRGLGATLARDVPFSAIYWTCYEAMRRKMASSHTGLSNALEAFVAGACAGALAATITTPFDVVKTLQQTEVSNLTLSKRSMGNVVQDIVSTRGVGGLMTGLVPRLVRVIPASGIMISTYEVGKSTFGIKA